MGGAIPLTLKGEKMKIIEPYTDEYLKYDEMTGWYYITEKALISRGIDLRARLSRKKAISPEYVINGLITLASEMIYNYVHMFSFDNYKQDYFITHIEELRPVILRALLQQATYILRVGDAYLSKEDRDKAISPHAINTLNTTIRELGNLPITYSGR
jgi:hypothetical protein